MSNRMWCVAVDGQIVGRMSEAELIDALQARSYGPDTQVYCEGVTDWASANTVDALSAHTPPPPPPSRRTGGTADDVDFEIHGEEMRFVEVELDSGESVVAEAGAMISAILKRNGSKTGAGAVTWNRECPASRP